MVLHFLGVKLDVVVFVFNSLGGGEVHRFLVGASPPPPPPPINPCLQAIVYLWYLNYSIFHTRQDLLQVSS